MKPDVLKFVDVGASDIGGLAGWIIRHLGGVLVLKQSLNEPSKIDLNEIKRFTDQNDLVEARLHADQFPDD